jgi:hypothetical protein
MPDIIFENEDLIPKDFKHSFKSLAEKIEGIVKVSIRKCLSGGFSDSAPLLVYADYKDTATYQVFKVGEKGLIDREAQNWERFIKNWHYNNWNVIHLKKHIPGSPHSLIVYNFAGKPDKEPGTFEDIYEKTKNPESTLKSLIEDILRPPSDAVRRGRKSQQILSALETISGGIKEKIIEEVQRLSGLNDVVNIPKIKINGEELYNPLFFYPFNSLQSPNNITIAIPQGIVHGDFHARNIIFYETGAFIPEGVETNSIEAKIPCIIDYAHTGKKSLYTDIAKMESALKFQLLKVDSIKDDELLQFEDKSIIYNLKPSNTPSITDSHLQKLFASIEVLRKTPSSIINLDNEYTPLGYWIELYKDSLLHIKYNLSDCQKRYAFISAALIFTRYLTTTAFKISEEIKNSRSYLHFPLRPATREGSAQSLFTADLLAKYRGYIKQKREEERQSEFPKGAQFIEPSIRLRIKKRAEEQSPFAKTSRGKSPQEKEEEFRTIRLKDLLKEKHSFVLVADSGLGKTTLMRELQYQIITGALPTEYIPIYFHFRDLLGVFSIDALIERIKDSFPQEIPRDRKEETVYPLFRQRRFFFLLDGLDQVEERSNLPNLLGRHGILSSHRVILTGRPYIYSSLQSDLAHYEYLTLDTFSINQTKEYLGEDFSSIHSNLIKDPSFRAPMILAILMELGKEAVQGFNRTQIYDKMIDQLLSREASLKAIQSHPMNAEIFKNIFTKLSYILLQQGYAGRFPWDMVDSVLPGLNITWGDFVRLTHLGIVSEVVEGSPLPGNDLSFRHQSFQEYLASLELKRHILVQGEINTRLLINYLEYNRWDEVLFFLIGSLEERDARAIISFISQYDLFLAGRCISHYKGNKDRDFEKIIHELFKQIRFQKAQETLAIIATEGILSKIIDLLKNKDEEKDVHNAAADALGMIGSERAFDYLIPLLKDEDYSVREAVARALGKISKKLKEEDLISLVKRLKEKGNTEAVEAIKKVHNRRFLKVLYPGYPGKITKGRII